jgi:hypothetical protein
MRWLERAFLGLLALGPVALPAGCSNSSTPVTSPGPIGSSTQPPPTKFEAGANCASDNDCEAGFICRFPATTCNALAVCVVAPPATCDHPQTACSCLAEPILVCDGYATSPVDSTATCDGGTVIVPTDGGSEGGTDATVPPADAGPDALVDAVAPMDASDAAGD